MNWVINNRYVLARLTRTTLEKADVWHNCVEVSREYFEENVYIPDNAKGYVNFACLIKDGKLLTNSKMYFVN